jgi:hypothetical protein
MRGTTDGAPSALHCNTPLNKGGKLKQKSSDGAQDEQETAYDHQHVNHARGADLVACRDQGAPKEYFEHLPYHDRFSP